MNSKGEIEDDSVDYNLRSLKKEELQSTLTALLNDPILADVPKQPTLDVVETLIRFELGSAMRVSVVKLDKTSFEVIVMNTATVRDLKLAIRRKFNDSEQSKMGHRHVSWRQVWDNFALSYKNQKLLDENRSLEEYGVRNNAQVQFVSYVASKQGKKHSKRRKHRFFRYLNKN